MNGWRFWVISQGRLFSPSIRAARRWLAGYELDLAEERYALADDGVIQAHCPISSGIPHVGHKCGIYFVSPEHAVSMQTMVRGRDDVALTYGVGGGGGAVLPDPLCPGASLRARSFRVHAILTKGATDGLERYNVPLYKGGFSLANMRDIERRTPTGGVTRPTYGRRPEKYHVIFGAMGGLDDAIFS